jgi:hypothetical protein
MLIIGQVSNEQEKNMVTFVAKVFIVGERFRYLARREREKKI